MAEEDLQTEVAANSSAKSGSEKNPLVTILLIVNAVVMGAVAYLQYTAHQKQSQEPSVRDLVKAELDSQKGSAEEEEFAPKEPEGILFPLEGFTANLAQGDGPRRYLKLNVVLKFSETSKEDEFKARKPQIRDTIIAILNSKRPEDLLKREGKKFLKEEIKSAINAFLIDGEVIDVYYVSFQIS